MLTNRRTWITAKGFFLVGLLVSIWAIERKLSNCFGIDRISEEACGKPDC